MLFANMAVASELEIEADRAAARGDFQASSKMLEKACAAEPADIDRWLKLAAMRRAGCDLDGALEAVTNALKIDPLAFLPLLVKAGIVDALGRAGEAGELYGAAVFQAPSDPELPDALRRQLDRARQKHAEYQSRAERRLAERMAPAERRATAEEASRIERFRRNALRLTTVYRSEPTHFHYPGLIEREFHDRSLFPWLPALEAATDVIRAEFEALMIASDAEIVPYIQYPDDAPVRQWAELNHSRRWSAVHLLFGGRVIEANAKHCRSTLAVLAKLPQPQIKGRSPNAMFSLLAPGARIPPHHGVSNARLVCHLPLVVPEACWFRVGAETRKWRTGEAWLFDDTIEHEAANESGVPRLVLIFDVWHPGLSEREREAAAILIAEHDANQDSGL